jgi:Dolichyl-phosphate-mannose-protein mannosyltransferase
MAGFGMANGVDATTVRAPWGVSARALSPRLFPLGVAAIAAVATGFLVHQLMAWPPHEDETLALFVGRDSLAGVVEHVTRERGGAPLHFLLAWVVAHLGFGLGALRLLSAAFAIASLPLVALLGRRLADRRTGLLATALVAGSWMLLFHGVYGRMYSLFLFLSLLSYLGLLRALERGRGWIWWGAAILACVAAHPYGALVLASQAAFVLAARRDRLRSFVAAFVAVAVLGIPFWLTDLVLAGRFDVGVGSGGEKLDGPLQIAGYLWRSAGDFSTGWWFVLPLVLALMAVGLTTVRPESRRLVVAVVAVPVTAFLAARLGGSTSPESRHLIFALPFFAVVLSAGLLRVTARAPALLPAAVAALLVAQVSWAWNRTPQLFEWEPNARQAARAQAEEWLAATSRPDDILFGYEPLYLGAWERNSAFPRTVLPRADAKLALRTLRRQPLPLGRGIWVLDASERNNIRPRLEIKHLRPRPVSSFETARFGPFLIIRTREPTGTIDGYLFHAARAQLLGRRLWIGDADVNMVTVERADRVQRGYGPSLRSRSSNSR